MVHYDKKFACRTDPGRSDVFEFSNLDKFLKYSFAANELMWNKKKIIPLHKT